MCVCVCEGEKEEERKRPSSGHEITFVLLSKSHQIGQVIYGPPCNACLTDNYPLALLAV